MKNTNYRPVWAFLATLCLLVGCNGENLQKTGGVVQVDGKPLSTGTVEFYPVGGGRTANAVIQEDGSFKVSYRTPGDGLPPGDYKVAVISVREFKAPPKTETPPDFDPADSPDFMPTGPIKRAKNLVPVEYNSVERSPLTITISDDGSAANLVIDIPSK